MVKFGYVLAHSMNEAVEIKAEYGDRARFLAGGTNLIPDIRDGKRRPELVIDITKLDEINAIAIDGHVLSVGAAVTMADALRAKIIKERVPVLWEAMREVANPVVRNRATIGGNLADASPAADTALPLLALDAEVELVDKSGAIRCVPLDRFFVGPRRTVMQSDEMLTRVIIPNATPAAAYGYVKLGQRNAMAISVVAVAIQLQTDGKRCRRARIALGAVAPTPFRPVVAEQAIEGTTLSNATMSQCAQLAAGDARPIDDVRASAEYRTAMVKSLTYRALVRAAGRGEPK